MIIIAENYQTILVPPHSEAIITSVLNTNRFRTEFKNTSSIPQQFHVSIPEACEEYKVEIRVGDGDDSRVIEEYTVRLKGSNG